MRLTPKQFLFCEYYIQTRNGTLSAGLAGYKGDANALAAIASQNLRKPKIIAYLKERYAEVCMDSDEVLALLAKLARATVADYTNRGGGIDWEKVREDGYAIKSIKHNVGKNSVLQIEDRMKALELIGRSQAMFTDKLEVKDWREELRKHDLEPSKVFEEYVKQFMEIQSED